GPGELVSLYPGQQNQASTAPSLNSADNLAHGDYLIGFIVGVQHKVDVIAKSTPGRAVDQGVQACQRVGGDKSPHPLDDIPVAVGVGGFDNLHEELLANLHLCHLEISIKRLWGAAF